MNKLKTLYRNVFEVRWPPYMAIRILTIMLGVACTLFYLGARNYPEFALVQKMRLGLVAMAILVFGFTIIKRNHWKNWYNAFFHCSILGSTMVMGWYNQIAMMNSKMLWKPFPNYQAIFMVLALLVPASYFLNFILILLALTEVLLIWFVLDISAYPNIVSSGEPYSILTLGFVSMVILFSRYRDEREIRSLTAENTANEFTTKLARMFLSIRDKSNSPMQTLILHSELLKRKGILDEKTLFPVTNAVNTLIDINKRLSSLESAVDWGPKHLLTDAEIEAWLAELEREAGRMKNGNRKT
jgi:hypothetical protein